MKFFTVATALVAGAILSSATPSTASSPKEPTLIHIPIEKRGSSLTRANSGKADFGKIASHLGHLRTKYQKNLVNFQINTGKEHPLRIAIPNWKRGVNGTGSVELEDVQENLWVGTLAYGTPPQSIKVDFDTGSADTLVNSGAYHPRASSTSVRTKKTFQTAYGDGTAAEGTVYTDVLTIGDLKAPKTAIGLSSSRFINPNKEGGNQGISGMSFPSLATFGHSHPPFFDSLHNAGALSAFQFAFKIDSSGSHLYLGGHNPSDITGWPSWVSVDSNGGFWQVPATADGYGSFESIVDTGTTLIVAPVDAARGYFHSIGVETRDYNGSLFGAYNCKKPPTVSFTYGAKKITLGAEAISVGTDDDGSCILSVVGQDTGIDAWITGDALLRNTVAIFDRTNRRVGFATRSGGSK
ncbi:unnamed protein product [Tilletia controversa]|uniref:Peptidase A1 domain-containing protein n=1 Tax=Tilletia caries TaxID=13290 RepID=A0A177VH63_9BASI|nr:hypothetical protein CF336_g2139 [Tilletia laevis]KAE8264453.1 hypothetical protein A4X03_0g932 [Tilletia caries]CAD6904352.1 unnamed protein product [Tilletia controversa]CAD6892307.1 unnamed protein product [Tilletia caries]CAD6896405.1 unnamed protein product [Tilletia caries]